MSRRSSSGALLASALFVASCGEIVEPEGFAIDVPTSLLATNAAEGAPDQASEEQVPGVTTTTNFVPRTPNYVPEVLISADQVVLAAAGGQVRPLEGLFGDLETSRAVDDQLGGLVVQRVDTSGGPGEVIWLPAQATEPTVIDDSGAQLLDVGYVEGSPSAFVLVDDRVVDRIRLADDERISVVTLREGDDLLGLSASGGLYAIVVSNERCGDLQFYNADGDLIDLNGPGEPDCIVPRRPAYGAVALSPDRGAVAYTVVRYRDDGIEVSTDLMVRDLGTGIDYIERSIGEEGDQITALSFDGERVAYLKTSTEDRSVILVQLSPEEVEGTIDLPEAGTVESVSFTRNPLANP